jgi:hypothetical protein
MNNHNFLNNTHSKNSEQSVLSREKCESSDTQFKEFKTSLISWNTDAYHDSIQESYQSHPSDFEKETKGFEEQK